MPVRRLMSHTGWPIPGRRERMKSRPPSHFLTRAATAPKNSAIAPTAAQSDSAAFELPVTQAMPQRDGHAILVHNASPRDMLCLTTPSPLVEGDLTVEAYVQLESYYPDGKVRVIVANWDGKREHAGWALGVTGDKSKFMPHTLILQLATSKGYEVVASDLHLELHKPYYIAASVSADDPTVTFHLKDVSDMDAPLKVCHRPPNSGWSVRFRIPARHRWKGACGFIERTGSGVGRPDR